jgi:hypothetical protein
MSTLETGLVLALVGTTIVTLLRIRLTPSAPRPPALELCVRRALAGVLGLPLPSLTLDASLARDLGCGPADLLSAAGVLEARLGIIIPEQTLRGVRTCRDLLHVTVALVAERDDDEPLFVSARLTTEPAGRDVRYTGWLTPATARSLADEAFRAGPGARLEVEVHHDTSGGAGAWLAAQLEWLRELGIRVGVGPIGPGAPPAAGAAPAV